MSPSDAAGPLREGDPQRVGHFRILGRLGEGGMGIVYRALDEILQRQVALKLLPADQADDYQRHQRFVREARLAASVVHPNVALVYQVGEAESRVYIAMEIVEGTTLRERLGAERMDSAAVRDIAVQIARGLAAAHERGVVHRDLKPENVMILRSGRVKILDFGLAKGASSGEAARRDIADARSESQITEEGLILGTTPYMSPEQAVGLALDARSDVFSFGIVLYEMLGGVRPFAGTTVGEVRLAIVRGSAPPLRHTGDELLVRVAMRCLEKNAAGRFADASEIVRALEGKGDSWRSQPRRARATAPAIALLGVVALGGAVLHATRPQPQTRAGALSSPPAGLACSTDHECAAAHAGQAWRCHSQRHVCVELASQDCKAEAEPRDLMRDDVVWLGGMFPLSTEPDFDAEAHAAELARREMVEALGSSADRAGAMRARPIGLVLCDEGADPVRAARHLAEDVEVPAVIGFRGPASARATIPAVFLEKRILSFLTIAQQADLTRLPEPAGEPRLVWRSTLNMEAERAPTDALLSVVLEPMARSRPGGVGRLPLKVAVVVNAMRHGDNADADFRGFRFNGKSALENGENFRQFVRDPSATDAERDKLVEALVAFEPEVLYERTGSPAATVLPLEAKWPTRVPPPLYIVGSDFEAALVDFIGRDPTRRRRFFAVTNRSTVQNEEFVLRYNAAFPTAPVHPTAAPQPSYDAFYVLAYATYALGDRAVTGPALSQAFDRLLPPGRSVETGPLNVFQAIETLRAGQNVDLVGAMGSLDFDRNTGEAPVDFAILCCDVDATGRAVGSVESGLVYDAHLGRLTGKMGCP